MSTDSRLSAHPNCAGLEETGKLLPTNLKSDDLKIFQRKCTSESQGTRLSAYILLAAATFGFAQGQASGSNDVSKSPVKVRKDIFFLSLNANQRMLETEQTWTESYAMINDKKYSGTLKWEQRGIGVSLYTWDYLHRGFSFGAEMLFNYYWTYKFSIDGSELKNYSQSEYELGAVFPFGYLINEMVYPFIGAGVVFTLASNGKVNGEETYSTGGSRMVVPLIVGVRVLVGGIVISSKFNYFVYQSAVRKQRADTETISYFNLDEKLNSGYNISFGVGIKIGEITYKK